VCPYSRVHVSGLCPARKVRSCLPPGYGSVPACHDMAATRLYHAVLRENSRQEGKGAGILMLVLLIAAEWGGLALAGKWLAARVGNPAAWILPLLLGGVLGVLVMLMASWPWDTRYAPQRGGWQ
jgi:hypothetical protein